MTGVEPGSGPRPERFPPGTVLAGRYRIIAPLGRGGMGDVYRADDLKLDQAVALKFLARGRGEDPTWLRRYRNEVRLARKVTHPNVMRVYDISEAEGEVFISMEYVDGEDLAALLRRVGRLDRRQGDPGRPRSCVPVWGLPTTRACCTATSSRPT